MTETDYPSRRGVSQVDLPWSQVWHLPVLLMGVGLFILGIYLSMPRQEQLNLAAELDTVAKFLHANNLDEAHEHLQFVQDYIHEGPSAEQARFWQYWADLNYEQLRQSVIVDVHTPATQQTRQRIAKWYEKSDREFHQPLDDINALSRWTHTLVALGRIDEAMSLLDRLQNAPAWRRCELVRHLIERERALAGGGDLAKIQRLVERFYRELRTETDAQRRRQQEIWVYTLEARLKTENGNPRGAIDELVRRLQRLRSSHPQGVNAPDLAPLYVELAHAYRAEADFANAQRQYRQAQSLLPSEHELNAEIFVGLGELTLRENEPQSYQQAHEYFRNVVRHFQSSPVVIEAFAGMAHCEAMLDQDAQAVEHFARAVEHLMRLDPRGFDRRDRLTERIRAHVDRAMELRRYELAMDYLGLLRPLHEPNLPAELILDFARTYQRIGEQHMEQAERHDPLAIRDDRDPQAVIEAQRFEHRAAAISFERAAEYYFEHAREIADRDEDAHGSSLWQAAVNYDQAQMWSDAIRVYAEYMQTRRADPRHLEAQARLGMAYLADKQYQPAVEQFTDLQNRHPNSPVTHEVLVPLAQAFMALQQYDAAERTLLHVVSDHPAITPEGAVYRQALIELGRLYYRMGEHDPDYFPQAVKRLEAAVQRYGDSRKGPSLRFMLADAYRRSVGPLNQRLTERQAQRDLLELQQERNRRLELAQMYYNQVITELDDRPEVALSAIERLYLRNAYFYQADCAYDRGHFELAIELYDQAARRWQNHPASLVAMVQIVNARCELGQFQKARAANQSALGQLERIPDEAFDDPSLPMSREHWEEWLRWTSELNLMDQQTAGVPVEG